MLPTALRRKPERGRIASDVPSPQLCRPTSPFPLYVHFQEQLKKLPSALQVRISSKGNMCPLATLVLTTPLASPQPSPTPTAANRQTGLAITQRIGNRTHPPLLFHSETATSSAETTPAGMTAASLMPIKPTQPHAATSIPNAYHIQNNSRPTGVERPTRLDVIRNFFPESGRLRSPHFSSPYPLVQDDCKRIQSSRPHSHSATPLFLPAVPGFLLNNNDQHKPRLLNCKSVSVHAFTPHVPAVMRLPLTSIARPQSTCSAWHSRC